MTSEYKKTRDEELREGGWVRQFVYDEPRLSEAVEFYKSLNLEVHLEPIKPGEITNEECSLCYEASCDKYKVIYTRPQGKK